MDNSDIPIFPTTAPAVFADGAATSALFRPVFDQLATMVDIDGQLFDQATPCAEFTVAGLLRHTLAWLQFFAAALTDPTGRAERIDPETWELKAASPEAIVRACAALFEQAIEDGVSERLILMNQARMQGDGVLAMALSEYQVHGWDLARATGRQWVSDDDAAEPALAFLHETVAPEYRGPDTGFFDAEVEIPEDASPFERLLGFTGRDPNWGC